MKNHAAYMMVASVESMCRETDQTPQIEESYKRHSLIFYEQEIHGDRWRRRLEEYEVNQDVLDSINKGHGCNREELKNLHHRVIGSRKNEFGLSTPIQIESARDNKNFETNPSLRFDQIYLPTIFSCRMQVIPPASEEKAALSGVQLVAGAGIFNLSYSATFEADDDWDRVHVLIDEQIVRHKMNYFELSMSPSGRIEYQLPAVYLLPQSSEGEYRLIFKAKGKNLYDVEVDVVVVDYKVNFISKKISIALDQVEY